MKIREQEIEKKELSLKRQEYNDMLKPFIDLKYQGLDPENLKNLIDYIVERVGEIPSIRDQGIITERSTLNRNSRDKSLLKSD